MSRRTNLATREQAPFLEMVAGVGTGKVFDMTANKLTVGRSEENDIVISSEAVSRHHAVFEQDDAGYWVVRDNQSKNGVQVNGTTVAESRVNPGDIIQVGNFAFRFSDGQLQQGGGGQNAMATMPAPTARAMDVYVAPPVARKKPNRRVLIYSTVGLLLAFLYMQSEEGGEKKPDEAKDAAPKLARDFKEAENPKMVPGVGEGPKKDLVGIEDPTLKQAEQDMAKLDWSNSTLREAEQYFRKGQREYLSRNFGRSIESFQTAISLFRGHELADKYLRLAVYNAEQEAKRHMEAGIRYFESLQYQRAIYHFNEVISLMAHRPSEPIVNESEKYIVLSKKRLQAAELFP